MDAVDIAMKEVNKITQELVEMGCAVHVDDSMHVFDQLVFLVMVLHEVKTKSVTLFFKRVRSASLKVVLLVVNL